jgi:hypothetical protein
MNEVTNQMVWFMQLVKNDCKTDKDRCMAQHIIDYLNDQLQLKLPL